MESPPARLMTSRFGPYIRDFARRINWAWEQAGSPAGTATSWWRSPADNDRVGGAPFSQHLVACAIDVVLQDLADLGGFEDALRRAQIVPVWEGSHLHIQYWPAGTLERYFSS